MRKLVILSLFLLITSIPANAVGMKSTMNKLMDSWVGEDINSVIDLWGYPSEERNIAGRHLYYWNNRESYVSANQYMILSGENVCNKIFEVDANNTIIKWQWEGNNCPMTYRGVKKYVNKENNPWRKNR